LIALAPQRATARLGTVVLVGLVAAGGILILAPYAKANGGRGDSGVYKSAGVTDMSGLPSWAEGTSSWGSVYSEKWGSSKSRSLDGRNGGCAIRLGGNGVADASGEDGAAVVSYGGTVTSAKKYQRLPKKFADQSCEMSFSGWPRLPGGIDLSELTKTVEIKDLPVKKSGGTKRGTKPSSTPVATKTPAATATPKPSTAPGTPAPLAETGANSNLGWLVSGGSALLILGGALLFFLYHRGRRLRE